MVMYIVLCTMLIAHVEYIILKTKFVFSTLGPLRGVGWGWGWGGGGGGGGGGVGVGVGGTSRNLFRPIDESSPSIAIFCHSLSSSAVHLFPTSLLTPSFHLNLGLPLLLLPRYSLWLFDPHPLPHSVGIYHLPMFITQSIAQDRPAWFPAFNEAYRDF